MLEEERAHQQTKVSKPIIANGPIICMNKKTWRTIRTDYLASLVPVGVALRVAEARDNAWKIFWGLGIKIVNFIISAFPAQFSGRYRRCAEVDISRILVCSFVEDIKSLRLMRFGSRECHVFTWWRGLLYVSFKLLSAHGIDNISGSADPNRSKSISNCRQ